MVVSEISSKIVSLIYYLYVLTLLDYPKYIMAIVKIPSFVFKIKVLAGPASKLVTLVILKVWFNKLRG